MNGGQLRGTSASRPAPNSNPTESLCVMTNRKTQQKKVSWFYVTEIRDMGILKSYIKSVYNVIVKSTPFTQ